MSQAGKRTCLLTLWRPDAVTDDGGGYGDLEAANPPIEVAQMWVQLEPKRGQEQNNDRQREATTQYVVTTGYLEGAAADASMFFTHGARQFDILTVMRDETSRRDVRFIVEEKTVGV